MACLTHLNIPGTGLGGIGREAETPLIISSTEDLASIASAIGGDAGQLRQTVDSHPDHVHRDLPGRRARVAGFGCGAAKPEAVGMR